MWFLTAEEKGKHKLQRTCLLTRLQNTSRADGANHSPGSNSFSPLTLFPLNSSEKCGQDKKVTAKLRQCHEFYICRDFNAFHFDP